jgi:hypothetical protein
MFGRSMILFTFKNELETRKDYPCKAFRWTFQISFNGIGFVHQSQDKLNNNWSDSHVDVYGIWLNFNFFKFGFDHGYYDGPHCSFTLGVVQICWCNWNCKKCIPEIYQ